MPLNWLDVFCAAQCSSVIVLAIAKAVSIYAIGGLDDAATRFTLRRILHLSLLW
jgi:hypothetical protein